MAGPYYLGIDCGTQGLKTLLLDGSTGAVVALARRSYKTIPATAAGVSEQDPAVWIQAARATVREITNKIGAKAAQRIIALAVSGQQHGMVAIDAAGEVIRPAKLWNDTSTGSESADLIRKFGGAPAMIRELGNAPPPGFTAPKVLWFSRAEKANYNKCATLFLPHDYINFWLTGERAAEAGDASGTGWLNIYKREYSQKAMRAIAADFHTKTAPIVAAGSVVGRVRPAIAKSLGLPLTTLVGHGGGDNMMAALGTGAVREGIVTVSLGTSGTAFGFSKKPVADPRGEIAGFCDSTGGYLPLLCIQNCTNVTEGAKALLNVDNNELERLAARAPAGARGIVFLPFFGGERTPSLPNANASILQLTQANFTRESFARAAMEAPTLGIAQGIQRLRELGIRANEVRLTGGGSKSKFWRQLCADVFGVPVVNLREDEGAALGAAVCAAWCAERDIHNARISAHDVADRFVQLDRASRMEPGAAAMAIYKQLPGLRGEWIRRIYT